jgi:PEP-CTERM motif
LPEKIMRKSIHHILGAALVAGLATSASAAVAPMACTNFVSSSTAYNDCVGLSSGNTSVAGANAAFAGDPTYALEYKDVQTGAGSDNAVFDLLDNGNGSVTLKFLQNVGDGSQSAVVALKFGGQGVNQLGFFRFDHADFSAGEALTFSWLPSFTGDGISHASVYANTVTVPLRDIPEPATMALTLAGLAAMALRPRRRAPR